LIKYRIVLKNNALNSAYNIRVWDTLPDVLSFKEASSLYAPVVTGQLVEWDLKGVTLTPQSQFVLEFTAVVAGMLTGELIENIAAADYNDGFYTEDFMRHPPVYSEVSLYPGGIPVFYPNPFNRNSAAGGVLKIINLVPGSLVAFYTISGELVQVITASGTREVWDGRNRFGYYASPGLYYYVVTNKETKQRYRGKLFIISK